MQENDKRADKLKDWLDGQEFYELCQSYRHASGQAAAVTEFANLRRMILSKAAGAYAPTDPHPDYITIYKSVGGWNSVQMTWSEEDHDYEPWTNGCGPYQDRKYAVQDGESWARDERLEFRDPEAKRSEEDGKGSNQGT